MNYQKLFDMQHSLDRHIEEKHQLFAENLFERKILALLVELGELANETRCFKFWSVKPSSSREIVLEEFVDGIHFILSLGLECGFAKDISVLGNTEGKKPVNDQFLFVFKLVNEFRASRSLTDYQKLFQAYLDLGELLGFNPKEIEQAYVDKNEINFKRQEQGY